MTRKEGFIEVDKMLEGIGVDTTSIDSILKSKQVNIIKHNFKVIHLSFDYEGETYFYKSWLLWDGSTLSPYNELVAEELAKDFGIPCVDYDLAVLKDRKGVISRNFKKANANYISGEEVLADNLKYYDTDSEDNLILKYREAENTLNDIWDRLEIHYHNNPNKEDIIHRLMSQIVNIYLFDIITGQSDRHEGNWKIIEYENNPNIAPLYDNERILMNRSGGDIGVSLRVHNDNLLEFRDLSESIKRFQKVSSEEFTNTIKEKLWIISEENLNKVFERIEAKTGYPMPDEEKEFYLNGYQNHKRKLEEILGLTEEREEHNERKNR